MPTRGSPLLPHSPFTALGSVGFASARLSSVLFVGYLALGRRLLCSPLLPLLLLPPALTWHCLLCNHLHPRNDSFYLLLAACCLLLLLLLLFLRTMEICMFPITALKSQPNSYNNNYGTIESCLLLMITIIIIIVLNDGPQSVLSVSRVLMPLLLLPSPANAVLQCKYSHRKWKYSWVHAEYKTKGWQKTQT